MLLQFSFYHLLVTFTKNILSSYFLIKKNVTPNQEFSHVSWVRLQAYKLITQTTKPGRITCRSYKYLFPAKNQICDTPRSSHKSRQKYRHYRIDRLNLDTVGAKSLLFLSSLIYIFLPFLSLIPLGLWELHILYDFYWPSSFTWYSVFLRIVRSICWTLSTTKD